ncbi:MAG: hypothetical protein P8P98_02060 [Emcibacteraceae bacterium]|nr:hypothetical protein [Emcibacteraceae bacterium]
MNDANDLPQERRITYCLYDSWEKISEASKLPSLKDLNRDELEPFKKNMVLLDLRDNKEEPTFQVIGQSLEEDLEEQLVGRPISDVPRRSMLSRVTDHFLEVLSNRVPIAFEAEFINNNEEKALYRGILLPFSDNGEDINFVLAGVRWILEKDMTDSEDQPSVEDLMSMIAAGRDKGYDDIIEEDPHQPEAAPAEEIIEEVLEIKEEEPFEEEIINDLLNPSETQDEFELVEDEDNPDENSGVEGEEEARLTLAKSQEEKFDALGNRNPLNSENEPSEDGAPVDALPIKETLEPEKSVEEPEELAEHLPQSDLKKELKKIIKFIKKEDGHNNRSRDSLYAILIEIYAFYHKCNASNEEYLELVSKHGLKIQERAPFTPVLKMCLGKDYDKTRLTEYAAALNIAKHMDISIEDFHDFIKDFPGGIKGCVKDMRSIRKGIMTLDAVNPSKSAEEARNILKEMPSIGQFLLDTGISNQKDDEFCLMVGKRNGSKIDVLKILDDSHDKLDPILKRTAFLKGNLRNK